MRDKPYALAAALTAREQDKERARACLEQERARLSERVRELEQAQAALSALTLARRTATQLRAQTGAELSRFGADASRQALQHAELVQRETCAKLAHAVQERRVRAAEVVLSSAFAEHAVIERHHAQFRDDSRKQAQNQASDEQDDVLAARAHLRAPR